MKKSIRVKKIIVFLKRLTIVDYLIVFALFLLLITSYKFFNPKEKWINITVTNDGLPYYLAYSLKKGDFERAPSGKKIAEIQKITIYDMEGIARKIYINTKVLVTVNSKSGELEYKNKVITLNSPIELAFNSGTIRGQIVEFENLTTEQALETKILTLKLYHQWPWFAEKIKLGTGESDNKQNKIIEIISKEVKPDEITTTTDTGETRLTTDPGKVEITLKIKIKAKKIQNQLLIRERDRIFIGQQMSFNTEGARIENAFITDIE